MNKLALALAVTATWASQAVAADHLVPLTAALPGYQATVRAVLKDAFAPDVRVRAIVEPSFQPEFAVGLRERRGQYVIFALQPRQQLWGYTVLEMTKRGQSMSGGRSPMTDDMKSLEASLPADPAAVKVAHCEAKIDPALALRIVGAWKEMLVRVQRPEKDEIVLDGVRYEFSMTNAERSLSGGALSPSSGTAPAVLVDMTHAMRSYCQTRRKQDLATLDGATGDLLRRLRAEE